MYFYINTPKSKTLSMKHLNLKEIEQLPSRSRAHLINSCSGYKSANLIATKSKSGSTNVAVFSSVTHVGSNPALLSFLLRPNTVPRNTYKNLKETGYLTINHIDQNMITQAHQSSAKYDESISEFEATGLTPEYLNDFFVPYVLQSPIKIGCKYVNEYLIKENGCILILVAIEHLYFDEGIEMPDGWLRLEDAETVTINGQDGYALPTLLDRFHYAQPDEAIVSFFDKK